MILPITIYSDEVLHRKAKPIRGVEPDIEELIGNMFETMGVADGIGLAAPQVDASLRLLVVDISKVDGYEAIDPLVVINPHIQAVSGLNAMDEGCLSIPDVRGDVVRPSTIQLKYRDRNFQEHTEEFSGLMARVLQHEIDHLDGTLFVDRLQRRDRRKVQRSLESLAKGDFRVPYQVVRRDTNESRA